MRSVIKCSTILLCKIFLFHKIRAISLKIQDYCPYIQEEQDFLLNQINSVYQIVNEIWIDAHFQNKTIHWSDNTNTNYTNWANGYSKDNGQECFSMGSVGSNDGQWLNEPCTKMNSVVCQKKQNWLISYLQNTVMELRETNSNLIKQLDNASRALISMQSDLRHVLTNASTGCSLSEHWVKCDTFVDFRTNMRLVIAIPKIMNEKILGRDNALNVCKKYNSTLVSIESVEKQRYLDNFIQSNWTKLWTSGYCPENGKWRWINGHELSYTNWAPTQPDNGYPNEPCLELWGWHDGTYKWNDHIYSVEKLVLCEFETIN